MTRDADRDARWAWGFVVLLLASAVVAQFLGYGMAVLLGYDVPEAADPPLGAALLISLPTLVVAAAPGIGALYFGVRAGRGGRLAGYLAAGVGGLAVVFWTVITMMALINRA